MFAGYINSEGKCNGVGYPNPFGSWENVVVQGNMKISLSEQIAEIKLNSSTIHLRFSAYFQTIVIMIRMEIIPFGIQYQLTIVYSISTDSYMKDKHIK